MHGQDVCVEGGALQVPVTVLRGGKDRTLGRHDRGGLVRSANFAWWAHRRSVFRGRTHSTVTGSYLQTRLCPCPSKPSGAFMSASARPCGKSTGSAVYWDSAVQRPFLRQSIATAAG